MSMNLERQVEQLEKLRGLQPVELRMRLGVDTWEGEVVFVNSATANGTFSVDAFWAGSRDFDPTSCHTLCATSRMRLYERGRYVTGGDLIKLKARLRAGLVAWEGALIRAGFTLPMTDELRDLRENGLDWHRADAKLRTDEAHANHFLRLDGFGVIPEGERERYHDLTTRQRGELYRIECGLAHSLTDDELVILLEKVEANEAEAERGRQWSTFTKPSL
jgi:hypothetical protein